MFCSEYVLQEPSQRRKEWLVPPEIRKQFQNGFTKDWAEVFYKLRDLRITRSTPHKSTPKRPPEDVESIQWLTDKIAVTKLDMSEEKPSRRRSPRNLKNREQPTVPTESLAAFQGKRRGICYAEEPIVKLKRRKRKSTSVPNGMAKRSKSTAEVKIPGKNREQRKSEGSIKTQKRKSSSNRGSIIDDKLIIKQLNASSKKQRGRKASKVSITSKDEDKEKATTQKQRGRARKPSKVNNDVPSGSPVSKKGSRKASIAPNDGDKEQTKTQKKQRGRSRKPSKVRTEVSSGSPVSKRKSRKAKIPSKDEGKDPATTQKKQTGRSRKPSKAKPSPKISDSDSSTSEEPSKSLKSKKLVKTRKQSSTRKAKNVPLKKKKSQKDQPDDIIKTPSTKNKNPSVRLPTPIHLNAPPPRLPTPKEPTRKEKSENIKKLNEANRIEYQAITPVRKPKKQDNFGTPSTKFAAHDNFSTPASSRPIKDNFSTPAGFSTPANNLGLQFLRH